MFKMLKYSRRVLVTNDKLHHKGYGRIFQRQRPKICRSLCQWTSKDGSKSSNKLLGKVIYLDIKDARQSYIIEVKLRKLEAVIETFFSANVNYVISSDPAVGRQRSVSPALSNTPSPFTFTPSATTPSPSTYLNADGKLVPLSRGQALAQMARSRNRSPSPSSVVASAGRLGIKVISLEGANKWLDRELKRHGLTVTKEEITCQRVTPQDSPTRRPSSLANMRRLKEPCVKVESTTRRYKPLHKELPTWPHINLSTPCGTCPFDGVGASTHRSKGVGKEAAASAGHLLSPTTTQSNTQRRSLEGEDSSRLVGVPILTAGDLRRQQEKQKQERRRRGYCECCEKKYDNIEKHLKEPSHKEFARDKSKYEVLDELIASLPTPSQFLRYTLLRHCAQQQGGKPSTSTSGLATDNSESSNDQVLTLDVSLQQPQASGALDVGPDVTDLGTPSQTYQHATGEGAAEDKHIAQAALNRSIDSDTKDPSQLSASLTAVVIRRPGARSAYGSPREKWSQSPSRRDSPHTPRKVTERSMIFGNTSIGSLQRVPEDQSPLARSHRYDDRRDSQLGRETDTAGQQDRKRRLQFPESSLKREREPSTSGISFKQTTWASDQRTEADSSHEAFTVKRKRSATVSSDVKETSTTEASGNPGHADLSALTPRKHYSQQYRTPDKRTSEQKRMSEASLQGTPVEKRQAAMLTSTPRRTPRKQQPVAGPSHFREDDTPQKRQRQTPQKRQFRTPQKEPSDVMEEDEMCSSPVYHVQTVKTSTPVIIPVRKLRSIESGIISHSTEEAGPRVAKSLHHGLLTGDAQPAPSATVSKADSEGVGSRGKEASASTSPEKSALKSDEGSSSRNKGRSTSKSTGRSASKSKDGSVTKSNQSSASTNTRSSSRGKEQSTKKQETEECSDAEVQGRQTRRQSDRNKKKLDTSNSWKETPRADGDFSYSKSVPSCSMEDVSTQSEEMPTTHCFGQSGDSTQQDTASSLRVRLVRCGSLSQLQTCTKTEELSCSWQFLNDNSMSRLLQNENEPSFDGFHGLKCFPDGENRQCVIDEREPSDLEEEQGDESLREFIPAVSSPGKSNSSWDDACDSYLAQSVEQQLNRRQRHLRSPRKTSIVKHKKHKRSNRRRQNRDDSASVAKKRKLKRKPVEDIWDSEQSGVCTPIKVYEREVKCASSQNMDGIVHIDEEVLFNNASPQKDRMSMALSPLHVCNGNFREDQGQLPSPKRSPQRRRSCLLRPRPPPPFRLQY